MTGPAGGSVRRGRAAAGIAVAVVSAATFGTSGIFASALISSGWSPAAAALARLGGSALLLAIPAGVQLRGRWVLLRRNAGRIMIYGLVAIAGGQLCYFNAIESIPVGLAVLLEYLGVVLIVGWLWAVRGQRPGGLTLAGAATALAGLALLAGLAGSARLSPVGITWGLLAAVSLAAYYLLAAAEPKEALPPLVMAWAGLGVGAAVLAVAAATGLLRVQARSGDVELLHRPVSWIVPVLALSLVSTGIAYACGITAARQLGARQASFIGMAEVLFATLLAWVLLGQTPSPVELAGGAFMLAGVVLVRVDENRRRASP
jgi:drug/metabolite transporter (DMT)-like permease